MFIRAMRRQFGFFHWGSIHLKEMDTQAQVAGILFGLPTYINRLYETNYPDAAEFLSRKSPSEVVTEFRAAENNVLFVFILMLGLMIVFTVWKLTTTWSSLVIYNILLVFSCCVLGALTWVEIKWTRSIQKWGGYYAALDRWGELLKGSTTLIEWSDEDF